MHQFDDPFEEVTSTEGLLEYYGINVAPRRMYGGNKKLHLWAIQ